MYMMASTGSLKAAKIPPGKRSQNKAYLVLLGLTGAGKTCTLNFLFDGKEIVKTESYASATSQILEYSVKVPVKGSPGGTCELRVIDTPGFGDTRQKPLERDAQFMASFDEFLKKHVDLKCCYPTTILLVVKYNDDRIDGETSHFIQMLKAIDTLLAHYRLIDKDPSTCNLIVVLTHTKSEDNAELQADPSSKIKLIEGLVKTFTKIPTPIHVVMAENRPDLYDLPTQNGYYKLPNGQYYPLNLFNKIQFLAERCDDTVGESIIREAFKNPKILEKELLQTITLLPPENLIVQQYYTSLQDAKFNIESTFISRCLQELWAGLDAEFTKPYFNTLQITQSAFHKMKIFAQDDIPKTKEHTLNLLAELPINPPLVKVLESLGINPPELPNKTLGVGNFYNVFGDVIINTSPFTRQNYTCTEVGFRAPSCIKARAIGENVSLVAEYNGILQYHKDRIKSLNVEGEMSPEKFVGEPKPGHNIIVKNENVRQLSGIREYRQYEVSLGKAPKLSEAFRLSLCNLPKLTNYSEKSVENSWNSFFMSNGTHVVKSAYGGGYIELVAVRNTSKPQKTSTEEVVGMISDVLGHIGSTYAKNVEIIAEDWDFDLHFYGGDQSLAFPILENVFKKNGIDFYKNWVNSLKAHPVLLHSELKLENIVVHVQKLDMELGEKLDGAMKKFAGITGFISLPEPEPVNRGAILPPKKLKWYQKFMNKLKLK